MATRALLHKNKLNTLKYWLVRNGWKVHEPKGEYEVLRATRKKRLHPLIVYDKLNSKEHLSVQDRDVAVIKQFIRESRGDSKSTSGNVLKTNSKQDLFKKGSVTIEKGK